MNTNLLDLNSDILEIIGGYVKKDNERRMEKICNIYVKLYKKLDTEKESERTKKLKGKERKEDNKIFRENIKHFKKLDDLIKNKYYDYSIQCYLCRTKPFIIVTVSKDDKYKNTDIICKYGCTKDLVERTINTEKTVDFFADIRKSFKEFNWMPKVELEEGIKSIIKK